MTRALEKIAFLPFDCSSTQWRWKASRARWRRPLQQGVVGTCGSSTRRRAAVDTRRRILRSRGQVHVPDNTPYTRRTSSPPSCSFNFTGAVAGGRMHHAAPPLLDLRQQGKPAAPEHDARDGSSRGPAGCPRSDDRVAANGCHGDPRLLRAVSKWLDEQLAASPSV